MYVSDFLNTLSGPRFGQDVNIIIKYKKYLEISRTVICKYTDSVMIWVLDF